MKNVDLSKFFFIPLHQPSIFFQFKRTDIMNITFNIVLRSRYVPGWVGGWLKVRRGRGAAAAPGWWRPSHGVRRDGRFLKGRRDCGCHGSTAGRWRHGSPGRRLLLADHGGSGGGGVMVWLCRCCGGDGRRRRGGIRRCRREVVLHHTGDGQRRWRRRRRSGTRRHAGDSAAEHQVQVRFGVVERTQLTLDQLALFIVVCVVHLEHAVVKKKLERGRRTRWRWVRYYNTVPPLLQFYYCNTTTTTFYCGFYTVQVLYRPIGSIPPPNTTPSTVRPRDVTRGARLQSLLSYLSHTSRVIILQ